MNKRQRKKALSAVRRYRFQRPSYWLGRHDRWSMEARPEFRDALKTGVERWEALFRIVCAPEAFFDITSEALLCQPEPQYLYAKMWSEHAAGLGGT